MFIKTSVVCTLLMAYIPLSETSKFQLDKKLYQHVPDLSRVKNHRPFVYEPVNLAKRDVNSSKSIVEQLANIKTGAQTRGEYEDIGAVLLATPDCFGLYTQYLSPIHAKLIDSAYNQNLTVFIKVPYGQEEACKLHLARGHYPNIRWIPTTSPSFWTRDYTPNWFPVASFPQNNTVVSNFAWSDEYPERAAYYYISQAPQLFNQGPLLKTNLSWEGGNFMADSNGLCISSRSIFGWNPDLDDEHAYEIYRNLFGCKHSIFLEIIPWDSTKHIDLFVSFARNGTILFGKAYPGDQATTAVLQRNLDILRKDQFIVTHKYSIVEVPMPNMCKDGDISLSCLAQVSQLCPFSNFKNSEYDSPDCELTSLSQCYFKLTPITLNVSGGRVS